MDEATAARIVSHRRAMAKLKDKCDKENWPYPPELIKWLTDLNQPAYKRKGKRNGR